MSCVYIYIYTYIQKKMYVCVWLVGVIEGFCMYVCMYICMYVYTYIYIWGLELCRLGTGQYTVLIDIQAGIVIKSYIYIALYIYIQI